MPSEASLKMARQWCNSLTLRASLAEELSLAALLDQRAEAERERIAPAIQAYIKATDEFVEVAKSLIPGLSARAEAGGGER